MVAVSLIMIWWGGSLVYKTFFQNYPEHQYIKVGAVYPAIPSGGPITLLFVIKKALGISPAPQSIHREEAP